MVREEFLENAHKGVLSVSTSLLCPPLDHVSCLVSRLIIFTSFLFSFSFLSFRSHAQILDPAFLLKEIR